MLRSISRLIMPGGAEEPANRRCQIFVSLRTAPMMQKAPTDPVGVTAGCRRQSPAAATARPKLPGMLPAVLLAVYLLIALAPLALSYLQDLPPRSFTDELSSALAMIAFAMLLMEFVLSGRFKSVSGHTGIDLTMRFHQLIARTLTAFILIHPFMYVTPIAHPLAMGHHRANDPGA